MREIKVNELKEGMTTAVDVFSPKGQLILKRHQAVSAFDIAKFGFYNIASVYVEGSSAQEKEEWNKKYAIIKEKYRDSIDNLHEYMNDILYRNIIPDKNTLIRDSVEIFDRFETSYELFDALQVLKQTDVSTMAHSMNVSIIARLIGVWAGLDTEKLDEISMAGLLHDIGKFKIPDEILLKPGKLTKEEFEVIKKHTVYGYEILNNFKILESTKRAALLHHEKFDGSGYPFGYTADKIDDISAIITIADVYDAMTSKRCYRDGMCPFDVIEDFEYDGISKYHPKYIGMFLKKIASSYIGSTVLLTNGKKAKIIFVTEKYSRPTVTLLEDNSVLVLKDDEKEELFEKIKKGDKAAREKYIRGNLRLVLSVIRRFSNHNENMDDLFQIGCIGLMKSIDNFDPTIGVKFSTYAVPMIIGEVRRYLRDNSAYRIPRSLRDTAYQAIKSKEKLSRKLVHDPSLAEISKDCGIPENDILYALDAIQTPLSLFDPVYTDGGDTLYVMDQISDKKNKEEAWVKNLVLDDALKLLDDRARQIIKLRFFEGKTQIEVAEEINISQAQVSRLEKNALKNMHGYLEA